MSILYRVAGGASPRAAPKACAYASVHNVRGLLCAKIVLLAKSSARKSFIATGMVYANALRLHYPWHARASFTSKTLCQRSRVTPTARVRLYRPIGRLTLRKRGQISLHDVYLVHGSEANKSSMARRAITMRFMPTSSVFDHQMVKDKSLYDIF